MFTSGLIFFQTIASQIKDFGNAVNILHTIICFFFSRAKYMTLQMLNIETGKQNGSGITYSNNVLLKAK